MIVVVKQSSMACPSQTFFSGGHVRIYELWLTSAYRRCRSVLCWQWLYYANRPLPDELFCGKLHIGAEEYLLQGEQQVLAEEDDCNNSSSHTYSEGECSRYAVGLNKYMVGLNKCVHF